MLAQLESVYRQFVRGGYRDAYKVAFSTPQFPYWFSAQAIYACYIAKRSFAKQPVTWPRLIRKFVISFAMTFASREIFASVFQRPSPMNSHPMTLAIFLVVFIVINMSPWDIVYKLMNYMFMALALAQGFNQVRYFTLILRHFKRDPDFASPWAVPIAAGFVVLDNFIGLILCIALDGVETRVATKGRMLFSLVLMEVFWVCTNRNYLTQYIGIYPMQVSALALGMALGLANGAGVLAWIPDDQPILR